jgi:hypothetical protein
MTRPSKLSQRRDAVVAELAQTRAELAATEQETGS